MEGETIKPELRESEIVPTYYTERRAWTSTGLLAFGLSAAGATGGIASGVAQHLRAPEPWQFLAICVLIFGSLGGGFLGLLACLELSANNLSLRGLIFPVLAVVLPIIVLLTILVLAFVV